MKYRLLQWLACPVCKSPDLSLETRRTENRTITHGHFEAEEGNPAGVDLDRLTEVEVMEGALHCGDCGAIYPIRDGIPRMLPKGADEGPATAHRWTTFDTAAEAWEQNFLEHATPMRAEDFIGKLVLDAGCGYGRHAYFAARYGAEVVALDSSGDAVASAAANTRNCERVHVVQGDVYHPPFREGRFDVAYSFGVLHHIDRPADAFQALGDTLRTGGRLMVWVYGGRQGVTLALSGAIRAVTTGLEPEELHRVSQVISSGLRLFSHTPYRLLNKLPVAGPVVSHLPVHDHHQWPFNVVVADVYDRLRIPVKNWFNREKLEVMFTEGGYADVSVTRRVRNNETFRATGLRR